MTRSFRAIRFLHVAIFVLTAPFALAAATGDAWADDMSAAPVATAPAPETAGSATANLIDLTRQKADPAPSASAGSEAAAGGAADVPSTATNATAQLPGIQLLPSVERPLHRLYCVEYARLRSGMQIFGDARTWWDRAANLYAKLTQPVSDAVMVFAGSKRIRRGHVAVVTQIVSPREIRVDHANWQNQGEIEKAMPVLDVSPNNDWSRVRVWDAASGRFGAHIYAIRGFLARLPGSQTGT